MALQDFYFYSNLPNGSDYLQKSFASNLVKYAPNGTCPLYGLTGMMPAGTARAVEHGYFSKTMVFPYVQINAGAGYAAGILVYVVDSTENILAADMLRNQRTGEIQRVVSVDSATQITVARAIGQVAAAAIVDNDKLYKVGNAFEQASNRPASRLMNPVRVMNYTQIFRNSWALPGTMTAVAPVAGSSLTAESREDCGMFHGTDIEASLIFGQKSGQTVSNQYLTTMDGLVESVRRLAPVANTTTAGATTTYAQLETALNPVFDVITNGRNGNERILFVGGTARQVINGIGRLSGTYQIVDGQTNFGLQFQTFKTSRGTFRMIEHPLFNSNDDWKKLAIAVDMPSLQVAYLRNTKNEEYGTNGQLADSGQDAVGGTLTTELTAQFFNPGANAVIWGMTAAA